jgi:bifunctional non-homologous end joining protein LigD
MLATLVGEPFPRRGWIYEEKYDGDRLLACKEDSHVRLLTWNGKDRTARFPRIAEAIEKLKPKSLLLDGRGRGV